MFGRGTPGFKYKIAKIKENEQINIKNPRINSKGFDTSAIMGFTNSLIDLIKRERPEYLAVCFDKGGSKSRSEIYTEYKANRDETPEAIRFSIPIIKDLLKSFNIPILEMKGFEADDIIGTVAKKASIEHNVEALTIDEMLNSTLDNEENK